MIEFVELSVTMDGKWLVVKVKIKDDPHYENVYLDTITIDTQDTYSAIYHSTQPVFSKEFTSDEKYFSIELNATSMNLPDLNQLFFIQVSAKGTPSIDTPCGEDDSYAIRTLTNMYPIYKQGMNFIKELSESCTIPQGFIDFILRSKAVELAARTGNYTDAAKYYRMFFKNGKYRSKIKSGGCKCGR